MHHKLRILASFSYTFIARYHIRASRQPFIRAGFLKMTDSPKTGEVHALPENEVLLPLGKKPRLNGRKSQKNESKRAKIRRQKESGVPEPCSADDVLWRDIIAVIGQDALDKAAEDETDFDSPFEYHQEVELEIVSLCSNGKSLTWHSFEPRKPSFHSDRWTERCVMSIVFRFFPPFRYTYYLKIFLLVFCQAMLLLFHPIPHDHGLLSCHSRCLGRKSESGSTAMPECILWLICSRSSLPTRS